MALPDFRVCQQDEGGPPPVRHFTVLAAETFEAGQVVKIDTVTGHLEEAADSGTNYLGVALDDAATCLANGTTCPVAIFVPGAVFSGKNGGAAFDITAHMYNKYDLVIAAGVHGVHVGTAGANAVFKVLGVDTTDTTAERVLVTAVPALCEGVDLDPI